MLEKKRKRELILVLVLLVFITLYPPILPIAYCLLPNYAYLHKTITN